MTEIRDYLQLVPLLRDAPDGQLWSHYDRDADVLYIHFHTPGRSATDSEMTDEGIILRRDGRELIGLTIPDASRR